MTEAEIEDHGNATAEDSERMVQDIDRLHFNSYLMGTLRQLVGVDLLREQEVYYLPKEGEQRILKKAGSRKGMETLRISSGGSFGGKEADGSSAGSPVSTRPPTSVGGSSAASGSLRRKKASPTPPAWSQSQEAETDTEDESPNAKRIRAAEAEGIAAAASGSKLRTRRSRRLDKEAAEYKPDAAAEVEESSDDEDKRRKRRKGRKRTRQSDAVPSQDGGEERKTKKLKTHESV
jgi:hypothetical protein